jgi:hypothetical protein
MFRFSNGTEENLMESRNNFKFLVTFSSTGRHYGFRAAQIICRRAGANNQ